MALRRMLLRGAVADADDVLDVLDAIDRLAARDAAVRDHRHLWDQIDALAKVLLREFGGPVGGSEGACDMAVRVLREQAIEIERVGKDQNNDGGECHDYRDDDATPRFPEA